MNVLWIIVRASNGKMAERRQKSDKIWFEISVSQIWYKTSESQNNTVHKLISWLINMSVLCMYMVIIWYHFMIVLYMKYWFHLNFHTESQFAKSNLDFAPIWLKNIQLYIILRTKLSVWYSFEYKNWEQIENWNR